MTIRIVNDKIIWKDVEVGELYPSKKIGVVNLEEFKQQLTLSDIKYEMIWDAFDYIVEDQYREAVLDWYRNLEVDYTTLCSLKHWMENN